jgi:hypothetical protein
MVTVSIDLGFYFSRVVAHYAVSPRELLQLPLAMFWMLSRNIDRLRAEEDVRSFQVARVAQADADSGKAFMEVCNTVLEDQSLPIKSTIQVMRKQTPTPKSN